MDDESLSGGMFDGAGYNAPTPTKKDFLAWHKPRKQFVRKGQWCEQINAMLEEMQPDSGVLKYLGLPGTDLLDLRYFHENICIPRDLNLRFLGFVNSADPKSDGQTELNISLDEVRRLPKIDLLSDVIPDNFCRLADESSSAWIKAQEVGTFDIVNLDLCDGFGLQAPDVIDDTYYNALHQLMVLQARNPKPWLLFLTTRTGKEDVHEKVLEIFHDKYGQNLKDHESFRDISGESLGVTDGETLSTAVNTPEGHLSIFLTGLCKWILGLSLGFTPPSKIEVKSTIGYQVHDHYEHNDLVSIAIKFTPTNIAPEDPMGLSKQRQSPPSEEVLAGRVLKRVVNRICADEILSEPTNKQLYTEMVEETAHLLELARYDVHAYREWAG